MRIMIGDTLNDGLKLVVATTDYSPGLGKMICFRNEWLSNSAPLASAGGGFFVLKKRTPAWIATRNLRYGLLPLAELRLTQGAPSWDGRSLYRLTGKLKERPAWRRQVEPFTVVAMDLVGLPTQHTHSSI